MIYVYLSWCGVEVVKMLIAGRAPAAWVGLRQTWKARFAERTEG